jgi:hypothetical protein
MKKILTVTLITIGSLANGLAGDAKYKSYIELQEERERIADARYAPVPSRARCQSYF